MSTRRGTAARSARTRTCLLDTGFLYALADRSDRWHERCVDFANEFSGRFITPTTVLPEVCYLINRHLGFEAELKFVKAIANKEVETANLETKDVERAAGLLSQYRNQDIGFVDATVVAIAERLRIEHVATTDRRHFSIIRPRHCLGFVLVPS